MEKGILMNLKELIDGLVEDKKSGTFKCPHCGGKVLKNTGYCVKCKKKVESGKAEGDEN
jgi:DNA-directed RNA polymerase subunit RPC12/RpoP